LPHRARALAFALALSTSFVLGAVPGAAPEPVAAVAPKVAIIVGPVGGLTSRYRSWADDVAAAATSAGASVAKAYSPNATWGNVLNAVSGANVIVYFGHGNGSPNPYSGSTELTDRVNGWGLNTKTTNGDADSWSAGTLVYCGEKALLGTLTSSDGAAQRQYCSGGPVRPASGFTMVYAQAHYAPGFGERYHPDDPLTTLSEARQRVANYSTPILRLGGTFLATAYGDAHEIVTRVLAGGATYGQIFRTGRGYSATTLTDSAHPDVVGARTWVQRTTISGLHFGDPDYWYAFAGDPEQTPSTTATSAPAPTPAPTPIAPAPSEPTTVPFSDIAGSKFLHDIVWLSQSGITSGCGGGRFCPDGLVTRSQMASFIARAMNLDATSVDHFTDDNGNKHEANINRLASAGITSGCGPGRYCPEGVVARDQMATFLVRALGLPPSATDWFTDDNGNKHESRINAFAAAGITSGCGSGKFCPAGGVTRGQMAAFLHRAFGK
jgi:hypothetical protein